MATTRENVTVLMDKKMHSRLVLISYAQHFLLGNKKASMSEIVNAALAEYMENHKEEFEDAIKELMKRGWRI